MLHAPNSSLELRSLTFRNDLLIKNACKNIQLISFSTKTVGLINCYVSFNGGKSELKLYASTQSAECSSPHVTCVCTRLRCYITPSHTPTCQPELSLPSFSTIIQCQLKSNYQGPDFDDKSPFFPSEIDDVIQYINLGYWVQAPKIINLQCIFSSFCIVFKF